MNSILDDVKNKIHGQSTNYLLRNYKQKNSYGRNVIRNELVKRGVSKTTLRKNGIVRKRRVNNNFSIFGGW